MDDQGKIKTKMYLNLGFMGIAAGLMWAPIVYGIPNIPDDARLWALFWTLAMFVGVLAFGATAATYIYAIARCAVTGEQLHLKG